MNTNYEQDNRSSIEEQPSRERLMTRFIDGFAGRWNKLDREFSEMGEDIKRVKELNGKATNHEIDL